MTRSFAGGLSEAQTKEKGPETGPFSIFSLPVGLADLFIAETLRSIRRVVNRKNRNFDLEIVQKKGRTLRAASTQQGGVPFQARLGCSRTVLKLPYKG